MLKNKVSVIINNYNYSDYLQEAFLSVLSQSTPAEEIIIMDDGSTDNSVKIARKLVENVPYARVVEQKNGGQTSAILNALEFCNCEFIAMLDSDDTWRTDHLEKATQCLSKHQKVGMYYSNYQEFGASEKIGSFFFNEGYISSTFYITALNRSFIGSVTSTLVFRKESISHGLDLPARFVNDWRSSADNILIWLASFSGMHKYENRDVTVNYRMHNNNVSKTFSDRSFKTDRSRYSSQLFHYFGDKYYVPFVRARALFIEYRAHQNKSSKLKKSYRRSILYKGKDKSFFGRIILCIRMLFY